MHVFTLNQRKKIIVALIVAMPFLALAQSARWPFGAWQRA